jgi:thioesterase-3
VNGTRLKIRGYHCDAYGHVNNARYLELYEEARWQFLEPVLAQKFFEKRNLLFIVVNINISYKKYLVPNQEVLISLSDITYNNKSMILVQKISDVKSGMLCSEATISFVLLNTETQKPETITDEIKAKFQELMELQHD